jgi:cytochrome b561
MSPPVSRFATGLRVLHWLMAAMIITMLFIGAGMVSTVSEMRTWLIELHKPLGILILCMAAIRIFVRLLRPTPALPSELPILMRLGAYLSHVALYALMIALPLVGWAMLSAGGYPVVLYGAFHLPPLTSIDPALYAFLRRAHKLLAFALFATILMHLGAALFHAWIRRDGVFGSMAPWSRSSP